MVLQPTALPAGIMQKLLLETLANNMNGGGNGEGSGGGGQEVQAPPPPSQPSIVDSHGSDVASTSASSSTPSPSSIDSKESMSAVYNRLMQFQTLNTTNPDMALSFLLNADPNILASIASGSTSSASPSEHLDQKPSTSSSSSASRKRSKGAKTDKGGDKVKVYKPRNSRMKVYADGFFMTFDKESSCGTKSFWRCERKNECPARMHTEVNTNNIVKRIHPHNHPFPEEAELKFYNLDTADVKPNQVIPVVSVARFFKCRRSGKEHAEELLMKLVEQQQQQQQQQQIPPIVAPIAINPTTSMINPTTGEIIQIPMAMVANPSPVVSPMSEAQVKQEEPQEEPQEPEPKKIKTESEDQADPKDPKLMEIANQIFEMLKKEKSAEDALHQQSPLTMYIRHGTSDDNPDENPFHAIQLARRTEEALRTALEKFCSQKCSGNILIAMSPKINVVVHDTMIESWKNERFFQIQQTKSSTWKLMPVNEDDIQNYW